MLPPATGRHHPLISRYNKYGNHGPSAPGRRRSRGHYRQTDKGEYILDNQTDDVVLCSNTGYRFVKRQSQSDPNASDRACEPRPVPLTASSR
jgi:Bacterial transglutaminase-like cysteine proteinase BTLCP